jgi:hypothetical protein
MKIIRFLLIGLIFYSCSKPAIQICDLSNTVVGAHAAAEMVKYLDRLYKGTDFSIVKNGSDANIQFLLSSQVKENDIEIGDLPAKKECFKIAINRGKIVIIAADERGLLNATYSLLEKLGCGFYISGDVLPEPRKWAGFDDWEMEDEPMTGDRFVFNWHNFLSGCTGWNLPDWQLWIDQANKMRFNGIMVHAYGNNPMFSFEYLGEKKATGYLNNTGSGRDWGNQHVNDVRRMAGGEIFDGPVYGAEASMAPEEEKEKAATDMMQQVFSYAEERGTKIIFALDFDTWMANPRNIIEKLPREAVFELGDGHLTPNPEHPDGFAYYEQIIRSLLKMYPEIDQLSVWHRRPSMRPGLGTIWMNFPYEKLPHHWKMEYLDKLKDHPEIPDDLRASGMFAYSKVIIALQKARDSVKPDLEISSGSWQFHYVKYADLFFPEDVALLPLDWQVVFDQPDARATLTRAGANRDVYPIIWAHHDDHRYIGRPYVPWENLTDMLEERNSKGFGIIHWTTRPLDLYFTSSARQVWKSTENEPLKITVEKYVTDLFGKQDDQLSEYYYTWLTDGPMFGRETSDHFIDLGQQKIGHGLESWEKMKEKTLQRLEQLSALPGIDENKLLKYQKQMEEFYLSFFENQILFQHAYDLAAAGKIEEPVEILKKADPVNTIQKYVNAIQNIGFTAGEKAMVFSMNTRWLADFLNLEQRLGMRPIGFLFSPTQHDPLAQAPGHFTYFIDKDNYWWRCLWEHEMNDHQFVNKDGNTALLVNEELAFQLKTMHGQPLPNGIYQVNINLSGEQEADELILRQMDGDHERIINNEKSENGFSAEIDLSNGSLMKISGKPGLKIEGIVLIKK